MRWAVLLCMADVACSAVREGEGCLKPSSSAWRPCLLRLQIPRPLPLPFSSFASSQWRRLPLRTERRRRELRTWQQRKLGREEELERKRREQRTRA